MTRHLTALGLLVGCNLVYGADAYFGIYLNGGKVGYSISREPEPVDDQGRRWSQSETVFKSTMLGANLDMQIRSRTLQTQNGDPVRMEYLTESNGRSQSISAVFGERIITVSIDNNGALSTKSIPIPVGTKVLDDATSSLILTGPGAVSRYKVHVLDPTTITLIENEVIVVGPVQMESKGQLVTATLVKVKDPRAESRLFFGKDGEVLRIEGALGMVMLPETREIALDLSGARTDLAESAAINVSPPLSRPLDTRSVTFKLASGDPFKIPSDAYQTVRHSSNGWSVEVHPVDRKELRDRPIAVANKFAKQWLRPSMHVPVGQPKFDSLTKRILGSEKLVLAGAEKISRWIYRNMTSNAGIGVLRDATEVLETKEGVCRDYAILAASLMRTAGIPTRVASGLIYDNRQMYYHAWVEVWSGKEWVMLDPTRADHPTNATRIKLAHGNVENAFTFPVLTNTRFEITQVRYH